MADLQAEREEGGTKKISLYFVGEDILGLNAIRGGWRLGEIGMMKR
jgi:hypothetical protein